MTTDDLRGILMDCTTAPSAMKHKFTSEWLYDYLGAHVFRKLSTLHYNSVGACR